MSDFFEIFQPGLKYWREQRDLDKVLLVEDDAGGTGPAPLDLDSGDVVIVMPPHPEAEPADGDDTPQSAG